MRRIRPGSQYGHHDASVYKPNEAQDQRPPEREMMFACFQLLGRVRANNVVPLSAPVKASKISAIEPWITTPVQGFLIVVP